MQLSVGMFVFISVSVFEINDSSFMFGKDSFTVDVCLLSSSSKINYYRIEVILQSIIEVILMYLD